MIPQRGRGGGQGGQGQALLVGPGVVHPDRLACPLPVARELGCSAGIMTVFYGRDRWP